MTYAKIRAVIKRGAEILEEPLHWFDSEELAHQRERELIAHFGRRDKHTGILTNHTDGGEGFVGVVISDETRAKMSACKMGNKINCGRKRPDFADMWKKRVSVFDENGLRLDVFDSLKDACSAYKFDYASGSDAATGKNKAVGGLNGVKYQIRYGTDIDRLEKLSYDRGNGKVLQITLDGIQVAIWQNARQAAERTGISYAGIRQCASGKQHKAGGYRWQIIEEG